MKLVGAGAETDGSGTSANTAVLCVVCVGDDVHFFDSLKRRCKRSAPAAASRRNSVEENLVLSGTSAVDGNAVDMPNA